MTAGKDRPGHLLGKLQDLVPFPRTLENFTSRHVCAMMSPLPFQTLSDTIFKPCLETPSKNLSLRAYPPLLLHLRP